MTQFHISTKDAGELEVLAAVLQSAHLPYTQGVGADGWVITIIETDRSRLHSELSEWHLKTARLMPKVAL